MTLKQIQIIIYPSKKFIKVCSSHIHDSFCQIFLSYNKIWQERAKTKIVSLGWLQTVAYPIPAKKGRTRYAKFVEISREFAKQDRDRKLALNKAIDYCIENKILKEFLGKYRAEVLGMLLEEFDEEKFRRTMREEGRWQATIEILQEMNQSKEFVKAKLLEKYALSERDVEELLRQFWKE